MALNPAITARSVTRSENIALHRSGRVIFINTSAPVACRWHCSHARIFFSLSLAPLCLSVSTRTEEKEEDFRRPSIFSEFLTAELLVRDDVVHSIRWPSNLHQITPQSTKKVFECPKAFSSMVQRSTTFRHRRWPFEIFWRGSTTSQCVTGALWTD